MRRYVVRRLLLLVPVLLGVSIIIFMVLHLAPGDPAEIMLGSQATQADLERLRAELGLTQPLYVQYVHWLGLVARGDLRTVDLDETAGAGRSTRTLQGDARAHRCRARALDRGRPRRSASPPRSGRTRCSTG